MTYIRRRGSTRRSHTRRSRQGTGDNGIPVTGVLTLILVGKVWGGNLVSIKISREGIPPFAATFLVERHAPFDPGIPALLAPAYQTFVAAFLSYALRLWMIRRYPVSRPASFIFPAPMFGVVFSAAAPGESVTPALAGGVGSHGRGDLSGQQAGPGFVKRSSDSADASHHAPRVRYHFPR